MSRHFPLRSCALATLSALALACPGDGGEKNDGASLSLEGMWWVSQLRAGTNVAMGTAPGWVRVRSSISSTGEATVQETLDSLGNTALPSNPIRYAWTDEGVVTLVEGPLTSYLGQLGPDGKVWVGTGTGAGSSQLRVSLEVQPGATFAQADLAGSWNYHAFTSGRPVRWEHGRATLTVNGDITLSTRVSSDGPIDDASLPRLRVGASGLVTQEAGGDPTWVGVLSADKDLLVATHTGPLAEGQVVELIVVTRNRTDVTTADLSGTWKVFMLDQDEAGGGWSRLTPPFGADGRGTTSDYADSHGGTTAPGDVALTVAGDGTIHETGNDRWHGALAEGADVWVAVTDRDGGAQATLFVAVRRP